MNKYTFLIYDHSADADAVLHCSTHMKLSFTIQDLQELEKQRHLADSELLDIMYVNGHDAWCKYIEGEIKASMESTHIRSMCTGREGAFRICILFDTLRFCHSPFDIRIASKLVSDFNQANPGFTMSLLRDSNLRDGLEILWRL